MGGRIIMTLLLVALSTFVYAQSTSVVTGKVYDEKGAAVPFASVIIDSLNLGAVSDANGVYKIGKVPFGIHLIKARALGFYETSENVLVNGANPVQKDFYIKEDIRHLDEVVVEGQSEATEKKAEAYAVEVIDTKKIQNRDINMNQLTTQTAGIRVRESGGLGSNFSYSLNGMSGRSVRFFVDGIPIDRYGSGYSINNFPVNLIERVEIYKGVVPPQFGSDALGGVINILSKNSFYNYLDASYSFGSFNTHRAALSTRWIDETSNLFVDLQGYYNYSDNSYKVWGPGVEVADPNTGRAIEIKTKRFHDAYRSASGKIDVGMLDKPWADQIKLSFLYADNHNELQHGATMASVIGEATRSETSYAPSLFYTKKDLFIDGLEGSLFSSISWLKSYTVDTSSRIYNWYGQVIDERSTNSEMGAGRNGKSLLTLNTQNQFHQANFTYTIAANQKINFNYTYDGTTWDGNDPLISNRTASFKEPQDLNKQVISLAYEAVIFNENLNSTFWVKNYDLKVATVDEEYVTDSLGYRPVAFPIERQTNSFGYGVALKYNFQKYHIAKLSLEKSFRLPDADELLGDGLFVRTSPDLLPEESINLNISWLASDIPLNKKSHISFEPSFFYRDTYNLILYRVQNNIGTGSYNNIGKVRGIGGSMDVKYTYKNFLELNGNATYQALRDWNKYDGANRNQTYQDLLPNTPYLMANGGLTLRKGNVFSENDELSFFWDLQYVHEFYLNWPSLGNPDTKAVIPTQFMNSTGISLSMNSGMYNVSLGCQNIFNEQVYDNYLLQKPGRGFSIKLRTYLK